MQVLNYFLLFCFINLYNSFTLINKQIRPIFYSRSKLSMGCDYYIDKDLEIYDYNNKLFSSINLEHERGYYFYMSIFDEDEDGYEGDYTRYIKETLEPHMKPIVIYSNSSFNKLTFESKYKQMIQAELLIINKTLNDVFKIIKSESRYER